MKDEVFEDVWKKLLEKFYPFGAEYYDPDKIEEKAKRKVKQILEEIWLDGYTAAKSEKWRVTYYKETFR